MSELAKYKAKRDKKHREKAFLDFFHELGEAVRPFRADYDLPEANINGCYVQVGKGQKKLGKVLFQFMARHGKVVSMELNWVEMTAHPREYIGNLLEDINDKMNAHNLDTRIFVPQFA